MGPRSRRGDKGSRSGVGNSAKDGEEKQINLGDSTNVKHTLDEAASEAILDRGYDEDTFVSNVKIALGILSITLALVAQFWPGKFHTSWWLVFWCVVAYMAITAILAMFCTMKEGNAFLFTKPSVGEPGLKVSSTLPRFSEMYTLKIESAGKGSDRDPVEMSKSITNYFHSDGYLSAAVFQADVVKLLHSFKRKD